MRTILHRQTHSVRRGTGESQAQWAWCRWGPCGGSTRVRHDADQLSDHARDQESLIHFYPGSLRDACTQPLHRKFRTGRRGCASRSGRFLMTTVIEQAPVRAIAAWSATRPGALHEAPGSQRMAACWRLANADVFYRLGAPKLQEAAGRASRWPMPVIKLCSVTPLEQQLAEDLHRAPRGLCRTTQHHPCGDGESLAQLPTKLFLRQQDTAWSRCSGISRSVNVRIRAWMSCASAMASALLNLRAADSLCVGQIPPSGNSWCCAASRSR